MPRKKKETKKNVETITKKTKKPLSKAVKIVILLVILVLFFFALIKQGDFGIVLSNLLNLIFGKYYFVVGISCLIFLIKEFFPSDNNIFKANVVAGIIILNIAIIMLNGVIDYASYEGINFSIFKEIFTEIKNISSITCDFKAGLIGTLTYVSAYSLFDRAGSIITLVILFIISAILIIPLSYFSNAAKYSKKAVVKKAISIEEAKAMKHSRKLQEEEKKRNELRDLEELKSYQEETNNVKEEFTTSSFFLDADKTVEEKDYVSEVQDIANEIKTAPRLEKNVQTKIEDAIEPKLSTEQRVLQRADSFANYKLPDIKSGLLIKPSQSNSGKNESSATRSGRKLIEVLANFGFKAKLVDTHIGPSVTKFEIIPDAKINVNKIHSLTDNLKMGLAAKSIRIEAPIPGKSTIGIEIPNVENVAVRMSELISNVPVNKRNSPLLFTLGKDLTGSPVFCELNKMPHLLIAGATGSGKSVCINTIISSFLLRNKPDMLKLVLVDPKKVEFTPYHDVPHLLWPVITDAKMASLMLKKIVVIMEERYEVFSKAAVRDISSYNEKVEEHNKNVKSKEDKMVKLPYIVVIIDELADLMSVANKEVEASIQRITQLARASGIHLIVATQRPSTDVITGLIKSNIPSRISFAVSSSIDSRTILDMTGAEKLLGNGDMLYAPQGENSPIRLQGCYLSDEEIARITKFCKDQAKPNYDDTYFAMQNNANSGVSNASSGEDDDLYDEVVEFIAKTKKASTSSLQRRFGIGYNRAARLIDTLEENGLIGPSNGSKPREVYVRDKEE